MSRKEDLERLILDSYEIIRQNDSQILIAGPKDKLRLQRENDEQWSYIRNYLAEYTALCERIKLRPSEDIIQIATARFADLATRLSSITPKPTASPRLPPPSISAFQQEEEPTFRMNYHFVRPFVPMDADTLVQFVLAFGNRGDVDFSQVDVVTHICLVLDVSGAMDVPDKYPYLLQAIPYIVDALSDNDWLSIVLFSSRSELVWSKDVASSRGQVEEIIQRIDQSGVKFARTYLAPGLQIAINEIEHFCQSQPGAVTRLYILTDGQLHDASECYRLNPELRRLEVEVNSYGFGQDFAEETMRKIMEDCQGGRVKWVGDTNTLWESFHHIGEVARNIVATDAELELNFSPNVTPGDAFRFEPGTHWFGTIYDRSKRFHTRIGGLEKDRTYVYAFEARLYPSHNERERIATVTLHYSFQGRRQSVKQEIFVDRTREKWRCEQVDKEIEYLFLVLEGLRTKDPKSMIDSLQARLKILRDEGGDPAQIELLEKAIAKLAAEGTLEGLSEFERRKLRADARSTRTIGRWL